MFWFRFRNRSFWNAELTTRKLLFVKELRNIVFLRVNQVRSQHNRLNPLVIEGCINEWTVICRAGEANQSETETITSQLVPFGIDQTKIDRQCKKGEASQQL